MNGKIRMIRRAVTRSAESPVLVSAFHNFNDKPNELRRALDAFLRETTDDFNNRFDLSGGSPLYNVYLLDPEGILLADTHPGETWLGNELLRSRLLPGPFPDPDRHQARGRSPSMSRASTIRSRITTTRSLSRPGSGMARSASGFW